MVFSLDTRTSFAAGPPDAMFGQPAAVQDVELPLPAGADTIQALGWNPGGNMLAGGSWDNKASLLGGCVVVGGGVVAAAAAAAGPTHCEVQYSALTTTLVSVLGNAGAA